MTKTIAQVLAEAKLYSDEQDYALLGLPPRAIMAAAGVLAEIGQPFGALIVDKDEVTLLILAEAVDDLASRMPGHVISPDRYRVITIDADLGLDLVGLMAVLSAALAEAGVPIFPYAAYTRDHIVVPAQHFAAAWAALEKLTSSK